MRHHALALGLTLLCACSTARADWLPGPHPAPLHTGPTVDFAFTFGGENLNRDSLAKDDPGGTSYYSGEGISLGLGMVERLGDSGFALKQEGGYWFQDNLISDAFGTSIPSDTDLTFGHIFVDGLVLYHWDDESSMSSVGIGMGYFSKAYLTGTGRGGNDVNTDFQNTPAFIIQYQTGCVAFRYTGVRYRVKGNNAVSISGSNIGIYLSLTWPD